MLKRILLAGDGGQGVQTIADILCKTAFASGLQVSFIPNYGLEQRGGVSLAFIKISDKKIVYPKFTEADVLLIMSDLSRERTKRYVKKTRVVDVADLKDQTVNVKKQSLNVFCLGVVSGILSEVLGADTIKKIMEEKLGNKSGWEENLEAFGLGLSHAELVSASNKS